MSMLRVNVGIVKAAMTVAAMVLAWSVTEVEGRDPRALLHEHVFDTERLLDYTGSECVGVPDCVSVEGPITVLGIDQIRVLAVSCPDSHPFGWHWDTEQHEHLHVRLVGRTRTALTFSMSNRADAAGQSRIFVGCSTQLFDVTRSGSQQSRSGVRSKSQFPWLLGGGAR
jgi:hypothetical protein